MTLSSGTYNLKISGVQDTTALRNTLVDYEGTFVANDSITPNISSVDYNSNNRKVTLNFGREMDLATLNAKSNYYVSFVKNNSDAQNIALPAEVTVNAVNGGKSVVLQFPDNIDGTAVTFGPSGSVRSITTAGLKSKTGQVVGVDTKPLESAANNQLKWTDAVQKDARTFELTFNQVIASANIGDFQINGVYPSSVSIDEKKVTLKTSSDVTGVSNIVLFANNGIETYSNGKLNLASDTRLTVNNAVAPKVSWSGDFRIVNNKITVPFTTTLEQSATIDSLIGTDFIIRDQSVKNTTALKAGEDYKAKVVDYTNSNGDVIRTNGAVEIEFTKVYTNDLTIQVSKDAKYIRAVNTDKVAGESDVYTILPAVQNVDSASMTSAKFTSATGVTTATAEGTQNILVLTAKTPGDAGNLPTVTLDYDAATAGTDVTFNSDGTLITVQKDATLAMVESKINTNASLPYTAKAGTGTLADDTFTFDGGNDAVDGLVTVQLSRAVDSIDGQVILNQGTANETKVVATLNGAKTAFTINAGTDNLVGSTLTAKVKLNNKTVDLGTVNITR